VSGSTEIEGKTGSLGSVPAGFDADGVEAKPVPKIEARVEFEVLPRVVTATPALHGEDLPPQPGEKAAQDQGASRRLQLERLARGDGADAPA
jgi:hypothetical protein